MENWGKYKERIKERKKKLETEAGESLKPQHVQYPQGMMLQTRMLKPWPKATQTLCTNLSEAIGVSPNLSL